MIMYRLMNTKMSNSRVCMLRNFFNLDFIKLYNTYCKFMEFFAIICEGKGGRGLFVDLSIC